MAGVPFTLMDYQSCQCPHGGILTGSASGASMTIGGVPVVLITDLASAVIAGCANPVASGGPCTLLSYSMISMDGMDVGGVPVADASQVGSLLTNLALPITMSGEPYAQSYMS